MRDREEEDGVGVGVGREERGRVADMQSEVSIMMPGRGVIVMSGRDTELNRDVLGIFAPSSELSWLHWPPAAIAVRLEVRVEWAPFERRPRDRATPRTPPALCEIEDGTQRRSGAEEKPAY